MKTIKLISVNQFLFSFFLIALTLTSCKKDDPVDPVKNDPTPTANTFTDSRDGTEYNTIQIGSQVWMKENLRYNSAGSFSYNNDASNDAANGRLYTWTEATSTAIPAGWHLPTDAEWKTLETSLGMSSSDINLSGYSTQRGTDEGTKLKTGGSSGLNIPMAGYKDGSGSFTALGNRTYLWINTTVAGNPYRRRIENASPYVFRFTNPSSGFAISVRLVKD